VYDWIFPNVISYPGSHNAANRANHRALPSCPDAVQIHTQLDFDQSNETILEHLEKAVTAGKGQLGATIFIVGGLMALRRLPQRSALSQHGVSLARRFWQLLCSFSEGLNCKVIFLGAGVAPRDNPPNLQPHAYHFMEELARLDRINNTDEVPVFYCDIYSPGSYTEYRSLGSVLQESSDMITRFVRDFVILAGEHLNPIYTKKATS
jgi:hypothetical protein